MSRPFVCPFPYGDPALMRHLNRKTTLAAFAGALVLGVAGLASAADVSDSMQLQITIDPECMIDAQDTSFNATGITLTSGGGLGVNAFCNMDTAYTVGVDRGLNDGANADEPTQRAALATDASGRTIPYQLFQDITQSQVLDGIDTPDFYTGVGDGTWQLLPFNVRFNRVNYTANGTYADTLNFTLRY